MQIPRMDDGSTLPPPSGSQPLEDGDSRHQSGATEPLLIPQATVVRTSTGRT